MSSCRTQSRSVSANYTLRMYPLFPEYSDRERFPQGPQRHICSFSKDSGGADGEERREGTLAVLTSLSLHPVSPSSSAPPTSAALSSQTIQLALTFPFCFLLPKDEWLSAVTRDRYVPCTPRVHHTQCHALPMSWTALLGPETPAQSATAVVQWAGHCLYLSRCLINMSTFNIGCLLIG